MPTSSASFKVLIPALICTGNTVLDKDWNVSTASAIENCTVVKLASNANKSGLVYSFFPVNGFKLCFV